MAPTSSSNLATCWLTTALVMPRLAAARGKNQRVDHRREVGEAVQIHRAAFQSSWHGSPLAYRVPACRARDMPTSVTARYFARACQVRGSAAARGGRGTASS